METKLDKYKELQPLIQKEAEIIAMRVFKEMQSKEEYSTRRVPVHVHNGIDAPKIQSSNIVPGFRANGSITMATDQALYTLGLNFQGTRIDFYGIAVHDSGMGIDVRSHVVGCALLGPTYRFLPQSSTSVRVGGETLPLIQGCSSLTVDETGLTATTAITSEENLVYVTYPGATQAAVATVESYGAGFVNIRVSLAADWTIIGNFTVS